jgi:hypothetical protein
MCYALNMVEIVLFLQVAERVLDIDADRLKNVTKIGSAESALAAPFASFGGHDFYGDPVQRPRSSPRASCATIPCRTATSASP